MPFPTISRQHVCITQTLSGHFIADLDSRNGTFIGKKLVGSEPQLLSDGDEIVLGGAITFRFSAPAPAAGDARARGIFIDETAHAVWVDGKPVVPPLSDAQMALLLLLYRSPGEIVSREQIIAAAWHSVDPGSVSSTAVDGLIKRLRNRLRQTQPERQYLQVARGKGRAADSIRMRMRRTLKSGMDCVGTIRPCLCIRIAIDLMSYSLVGSDGVEYHCNLTRSIR